MRDDRSDRPTPRAGRPEILLASERLGFLRPALEPRYRVHSRPDGDETAASAPLRGVPALVSGGAHDPAPLLARLPGVGLVQRIGAGYEGVDLAAAKARGVQVANTPSVNAADVADLALALFLHLACRLGEADGRVRSGDWRRSGAGPVRRSLRDLRVGVVGMGAIGQAIAARVAAFGCALRWWGPSDKPGLACPRVAKLEALAA